MLSSVLSLLWLLCGLAAALTMLSLLGRVGKGEGTRNLRTVHRAFGWCFSAGTIAFLAIMIPKWIANGPLLPASLAIHAALGLLLLPLLLFKHLVVRLFKRYMAVLPYLGVLLFTIAFALAGLTGLRQILLWAEGPRVMTGPHDAGTPVSVALGRDLLQNKCSRCHPLKPVYLYRKSEEEWRLTVNRMCAKDRSLTSSEQVAHIVGYLANSLGPPGR